MNDGSVRYKRARFSTRLPVDRLYTASHYWLREQPKDIWRIGFTKFATRMLGDPVELDFEVAEGNHVELGQIIGWIEGFKAVTDLFSPMAGRFQRPNPALSDHIASIKSSPYDRGWLYELSGSPEEDCVDAQGYAVFLDTTIDEMMGKDG